MPIRDRLELEGPDGQAYRPTLDQAGRGRKIDGDHRLELERVGKKVHMGLVFSVVIHSYVVGTAGIFFFCNS